jgi:peptide/nickel transport system ATP-binding protein
LTQQIAPAAVHTTTLDVQALCVELEGDAGVVRAIDGLQWSMARGETFALVGESGCGKSMTALALMRLLPESGRVTAGSVHLQGQDTLALPERDMRRLRGGRIGMIFQEPGTSLNPVLTVGVQLVETIETHTELRGDAARRKAIEWLTRVGIPEPERRIDDYPFRMSGGQKQRVMIAIALAAEPDFLIADEPTTALDVTVQKQILDLLQTLQAEQGMGLLLITHDLGVVAGMAHRVALMYAGQIVEVAPAATFFSAPHHPYARALLAALPDAARKGEALTAITGTVPSMTGAFEGCRFAPRCAQALPACATTVPAWTQRGAQHAVRCLRVEAAYAPLARTVTPPPVDSGESTRLASVPISDRADVDERPPLLSVRDLRVRFPVRSGFLQRQQGFFNAVDGVSFEVPHGSTLALVGESGCGKTTTGKAIVQLLRRTAVIEGSATLGGRNLVDLQGEALTAARRDIQIIFQDPFASLNPRLRVADILEEGLLALRPDQDASARRTAIHVLCEQVGLRHDALQRFPHEFSGGQRQRIAIARALAVRPKLIVCDEPTSALDVSVQAQILNLLRDLQRGLGLSYLFITHNMGVVAYMAERVAVMRHGVIVEQGFTHALFGAPSSPYTRQLLAAVPRVPSV